MNDETGPEMVPQGGEDAGVDAAPGTDSADELVAVREVILRAHPDTVPELVGGGTMAELLASVEPARAAYQWIVANLADRPIAQPVSPTVPAGTTPPVMIDPDRLPASEKIRRGLCTKNGK